MTIAVDLGRKATKQNKQTNKTNTLSGDSLFLRAVLVIFWQLKPLSQSAV